MLSGFADLELPALARALRRTVISALIVGAVGVVAALMLSASYLALGIGLGVAMAIMNLRFLDSGVSKVQTRGETNKKVVRRILGTRTATRLAIITAIVIGLLVLNGPLGIGTVIGLVILQLLFVMNMARAIMSTGVS
ncbi:MAG TPA: ATP synthase subunit I [Acidimicrobiales bacterium]|nr:ATP synthase subunit I [Acidimicrobiales bacterium]